MASNAIRISILANARDAIAAIGRTTRAVDKLDRSARRASRGGIAAAGKQLDKLGKVAKVAGAGLKIGGKAIGYSLMGFVALGIASGAGQVASALTAGLLAAAPAVGVLPGFVLAAASAMTVLKVATSGVSDALSEGFAAAASGSAADLKKFNESIKDLAPAVQSTVREMVKLRPALINVRNAIAEKLFTGFTTEVRQLAQTWLPLLTRHGENVAGSLNKAATGVSNFLTESSTVSSITKIFGRLETAISNIAAGVPNLVRGFLPLLSVSSSFLPGLTSGFGKAAERFADFMEQAEKSGELKAFIQGGIDALKTLTGILGSVGGILKSVFVDANTSAGSFFAVIGTVLKRVDDFLNSAEGMKALSAIWEVFGAIGSALGGALGAILPQLGKALIIVAPSIITLAQGFGKFLEVLSPILPVIGELASVFADNLAKALPILAPALLAVGEAISAVLSAAAPLLPVIAEVASVVGLAFADAIEKLTPALTPLIAALGDGLLTIINALAPILPVIADVLVLLLNAVTPLIQPFADLAAQLAGGFVQALTDLMPSLEKLIPALGDGLLTIVQALVPVMPQMVDAFLALVPSTIALLDAVVPLIPQIAELAALFIDKLMPILVTSPKVIGFLASSVYPLIAAIQAITAVLPAVTDGVRYMVNHTRDLFQWWVEWILLLPAKIVDGLVGGLEAGWSKVTDFFGGAVDGIVDGISGALGINSPSKVMAGIGVNIGKGLTAGIQSQVPALRKTIASVSGVVSNGIATDATVKLGADSAITGAGTTGTGLAPITVNVMVAPGADLAEAGRKTVAAIEAWQRRSGRRLLVTA